MPKSKKQTLQETIRRLEARIQQLERSDSTDAVVLHPSGLASSSLLSSEPGISMSTSSFSQDQPLFVDITPSRTLNAATIKSLVDLSCGTYPLNSPPSLYYFSSDIGDTFQEVMSLN